MITEREFEILSRRAKGESQAKIAKALKITQAAVSQFESSAKKKILEAEELLGLLKKNNVSIIDSFNGKKVVYTKKPSKKAKRGGSRE